MFKTIFLLASLFFIANHTFAQQAADSNAATKNFFIKDTSLHFSLLSPVLPANYYTTKLPFFCNAEWKLEKATKIPFRFRLGSVEYCDKMEGKGK